MFLGTDNFLFDQHLNTVTFGNWNTSDHYAVYNFMDHRGVACFPGARERLLASINNWIPDPCGDSFSIYWLNGLMGSEFTSTFIGDEGGIPSDPLQIVLNRGHASEFSVKSVPPQVVERVWLCSRATNSPQQLSRAENNIEFNLYTCT